MFGGRAFEVKYLDLLIKKMQRIGYSLSTGLRKPMDDSKAYIDKMIPPYPPPPPNSTYTRTGELGNQMISEVRPLGSSVVMYLGSKVPYSPLVIKEKTQARIHRGRWWTIEQVLEKARDGVLRIFEDTVKRWMA